MTRTIVSEKIRDKSHDNKYDDKERREKDLSNDKANYRMMECLREIRWTLESPRPKTATKQFCDKEDY